MRSILPAALGAVLAAASLAGPASARGGCPPELEAMIARHAARNGVPASLVHRVIVRESRYNPRASHAGNYGLMQIKLQTARGLGYRGSAAGLLDPETNLTYAVAYLAGAHRAGHGNPGRAVALYSRGYYGLAKAHVPGPKPLAEGQLAAITAGIDGAAPAASEAPKDPVTRALDGLFKR